MQDQQVAQPKAAAFIVAKGSTSRSIGYREENAPTLVADQGNNSAVLCPIPVAQPFRKVRRAQSEVDFETWEKDEKANTLNCFDQGDVRSTNVVAQPIAAHKVSPTLTAKMQGMSGWAPYNETEHLVPVAQPIAVDAYNQTINEKTTQTIGSSASDVNHYGAVLEQKSVGALCARDYKGVGSQYVDEGKVIASLVARGPHAVANPKVFDWQSGGDARGLDLKDTAQLQRCQTPALLHTMAIRRLTPKECERLQGFPDDWTKIPYRNKPADQCPDGPRYKACGNSMAVPVMRWIGERIQMIENHLNP